VKLLPFATASVRGKFCLRPPLPSTSALLKYLIHWEVESAARIACIALFGLDITQRFCRQKLTLRDAYTCVPFDSHVLGKIFLCFAIHNRSVKVLVLGLNVLGLIRPLCN